MFAPIGPMLTKTKTNIPKNRPSPIFFQNFQKFQLYGLAFFEEIRVVGSEIIATDGRTDGLISIS